MTATCTRPVVLVVVREADGARRYVGCTVEGDWLLVPLMLAAYPFHSPATATMFADLFRRKPAVLKSHGCSIHEVCV